MTTAPQPWYADETFWSSSFPFLFPKETFERAWQEVPQIMELTGRRAGSVLDLACGPGRHAIPFAERGFQVTGVDSTAFLLERARRYAAERGVEVEWVEEDMRTFKRPGAFDLAISLFTSFGFFEDRAENEAVLANVYASLRPGGHFVIDVMGKEIIALKFQPAAVSEVPEGGLMVQRRNVIDSWSRMANEWLFVEGDAVRSVKFSIWLYSARELADALLRAGFSEVTLCGGLDGSLYGTDAKRLVAVAAK